MEGCASCRITKARVSAVLREDLPSLFESWANYPNAANVGDVEGGGGGGVEGGGGWLYRLALPIHLSICAPLPTSVTLHVQFVTKELLKTGKKEQQLNEKSGSVIGWVHLQEWNQLKGEETSLRVCSQSTRLYHHKINHLPLARPLARHGKKKKKDKKTREFR